MGGLGSLTPHDFEGHLRRKIQSPLHSDEVDGGQVALKSAQGVEQAGEYRISEGSMTKHLYYEDSYLSRFQAHLQQVVVAGNISEIILDQSAFYPTSGGQPHDRGTVNGLPVVEVSETEKGEILHRIGGIIEGENADCQIDWDRRFDFMQQHTGQHVLSQAFLKLAQANTVGFHLGADYATIDLDCESLSPGLIGRVEELANSIVEENRRVEARIVAAGEVVWERVAADVHLQSELADRHVR